MFIRIPGKSHSIINVPSAMKVNFYDGTITKFLCFCKMSNALNVQQTIADQFRYLSRRRLDAFFIVKFVI